MSTRNIAEEVEAARRYLGQLASAARKRVDDIDQARDGLDRERRNVRDGARLALQGIDDEDDALIEERSQLTGVVQVEEPEPQQTAPLPEEEVSQETPDNDGNNNSNGNENRQQGRRFVVANSVLGAVFAFLAGLLMTYLLWDFATSGWVMEFPTILLGIVKSFVAAAVVYAVALAAGTFGDILTNQGPQWAQQRWNSTRFSSN